MKKKMDKDFFPVRLLVMTPSLPHGLKLLISREVSFSMLFCCVLGRMSSSYLLQA